MITFLVNLMEDTLRKTCEWIQNNQKILDSYAFIMTHDPVTGRRLAHDLLINGQHTFAVNHEIADSVFKRTYLVEEALSRKEYVIGITKKPVRIDAPELAIAKRLQQLNLPYIVQIQSVKYLPTGQKALVYTYYDGGTLADHLKTGTLTVSEKQTLSRQLVSAVASLHQNGIIHRDLKTTNILLSLSKKGKIEQLYLCDFGEATLIESPRALENIEYFHCPPEANRALHTHKVPWENWKRLIERQNNGEQINADEEARVQEEVNPLADLLHAMAADPLYDSWSLGLTLYCLWTNSSSNDFSWTADGKEVAHDRIAQLKEEFANTLSADPIPKDVIKSIHSLLATDPKLRKTAAEIDHLSSFPNP